MVAPCVGCTHGPWTRGSSPTCVMCVHIHIMARCCLVLSRFLLKSDIWCSDILALLHALATKFSSTCRLWELRFGNVSCVRKHTRPDSSKSFGRASNTCSAQIPWLYGLFYGPPPNKHGATMPHGIQSTKPLAYVEASYVYYISRSSSVSRTFLKRKFKIFDFFRSLKQNLW